MFTNFLFVFILAASVSIAVQKKYSADSNCRSRRDYECDDGSCVDEVRICDGKKDCADGGDELICTTVTEVSSLLQGKCDLPPYPDNGHYTTIGNFKKSGNAYTAVIINVTCGKGYEVNGSSSLHCINGKWSKEVPNCVSQCKLMPDDSVEYHCPTSGSTTGFRPCKEYEPRGTVVTPKCRHPDFYSPIALEQMRCIDGNWNYIARCKRAVNCKLTPHASVEYLCLASGAVEGSRVCDEYVPPGTVVSPTCRRPNFYSTTPLSFMQCIDGSWNYVAKCSPECGRVAPHSERLRRSVGGRSAQLGEVPWHAGIYSKKYMPYQQICGGSLISNQIVLSAAHCFWDHYLKKLPSTDYAVAVGSIYRPWNNSRGEPQRSDVEEVYLPIRFQGAQTNYQDNIAIVIVKTAFTYNLYVRPVCISFDIDFERKQLQPGNTGKVAGWGLTAEDGGASPVLKVIDLPYVPIDVCIADVPPSYREYITSDAICAGFLNGGKALCKGDSGGGLVFSETERGVERYYLRGISSTGPPNDHQCNVNSYTTFTQISRHERFIKTYG